MLQAVGDFARLWENDGGNDRDDSGREHRRKILTLSKREKGKGIGLRLLSIADLIGIVHALELVRGTICVVSVDPT